MDLETARQTLSLWVENEGAGVCVPEYILALKECALADSKLDLSIFSVLRKKEGDPSNWELWLREWSLWAHHTAIIYAGRRPHTAEIATELRHIKKIAMAFLGEHPGLNPCGHQLSYHPLQSIVGVLEFL